MTKKNARLRWHEALFLSFLNVLFAVAIANKVFTRLIGGRSYSEMGPSKNTGIAFAVSYLENTYWKYALIIFFLWLAYIYANKAFKSYKKK
ncbi:MAG: hypothetical protein WBA74_18610 [Cyclobacteriaceae bacterium]